MSQEESQSKDKNQGISALLITGLLAILGTVTGELIKGYWESTLADKDFQAKLILGALESDNVKERKESLEFLVTTKLITEADVVQGISKTIDKGIIPRFRPSDSTRNSGVQAAPSARQQIINRDPSLENGIVALVGLKVRSGDVVDAITPIFAEITPKLEVSRKIEGDRIGGEDGGETLLEREGYIITGINIERGVYFGRDEVIHIEVVWSRLTSQGIDQNDAITSEKLGSGNYATISQRKELRTESGNYISDIRSYTSDHTSGETFLHDIYIKQEKLPLTN